MSDDLISRQAAIDAIYERIRQIGYENNPLILSIRQAIRDLPSAQSEIAENLYPYKCYITDNDGLQHEVIHTGDIRRVTGWEI